MPNRSEKSLWRARGGGMGVWDGGKGGSELINLVVPHLAYAVWGCLIVFLATMSTGCDLVGKKGPEEVRLQIQGTAGESVRLITSSFFLTERFQGLNDDGTFVDSLSIVLLDADTIMIDLPYDDRYNISSQQRFYAKMNRFSPENDDLLARMWVDDDLKFERQPGNERDSLQFIYNFRGAPGQENVEL